MGSRIQVCGCPRGVSPWDFLFGMIIRTAKIEKFAELLNAPGVLPLYYIFFILGGGSFIFLLFCPGTISVLTALVNLMLPGADLAISWLVLRSEAALIADNPDGAGFIGLVKNEE